MVENIMGNEENAFRHYLKGFSPFPVMFQKSSCLGVIKTGACLVLYLEIFQGNFNPLPDNKFWTLSN